MRFLARATHDEIVALLQQQLNQAQQQLRELAHERDYYRNQFLKRETKAAFPVLPAEAPALPAPSLTEEEQRKAFRLDRSDWTIDDREFYADYWLAPNRYRWPDDEMDWHYHQQYGNTMPIVAFTQD